jgi:ABC-type sulfate transport system permease subunit
MEILDNQYNCVAAFAVASLLAILALLTLAANAAGQWKARRHAMDVREPQASACGFLRGELHKREPRLS